MTYLQVNKMYKIIIIPISIETIDILYIALH